MLRFATPVRSASVVVPFAATDARATGSPSLRTSTRTSALSLWALADPKESRRAATQGSARTPDTNTCLSSDKRRRGKRRSQRHTARPPPPGPGACGLPDAFGEPNRTTPAPELRPPQRPPPALPTTRDDGRSQTARVRRDREKRKSARKWRQ